LGIGRTGRVHDFLRLGAFGLGGLGAPAIAVLAVKVEPLRGR
jgi:hypothetical protein